MTFFRKASAFFLRDFISEKNYRTAFLVHIFNIITVIAFFYFMAKLFTPQQNLYLARYKGDYFTFLLIGLAYVRFLYTWINCFADSLQSEFYNGSLEIMLATPTNIFEILFFSVLWNQIFAFIQVGLYLFAGAVFFKAHFASSGYILALVIILISMPIFTGVGIIYAALLMAVKKGGSLRIALMFVFTFFGGVYFPIELLPRGLQLISYFLPITYSLRAIREVLINGQPISFIYKDLLILTAFSVVLFSLSLFIFKQAFVRARSNGSLTHY